MNVAPTKITENGRRVKSLFRSHSLAQNGFFTLAVAFMSGLLMTLAFPPVDAGWIAYFALVPFLCLFPFERSRTAFVHGFVCGLAYFCGLLYWIAVFAATKIGAFGVTAWFVLSTRESLWVGVFAVGINFIWNKGVGWGWRIFSAASLWTFCEWIRQLGPLGFGWGDLAYSQWRDLPIIQIASVTGIWGISWLIVLVNAAIASGRKYACVTAAAFVAMVLIFAVNHPIPPNGPDNRPIAAAALQANIFEDVPYAGLRPADSSYFNETLQQFDQMAAVAKSKYDAAICVTAETSIPGYPSLDPGLRAILSGIARRHRVTLIVGARSTDIASANDTNSVFVFAPNGAMAGPYNKQQLVPFGEYVPYRQQMPFLNSFHVLDYDMQPGLPNQAPLPAGAGGKAGISVCYESTYPRFMREQVRNGATFDVVVTDDAWYGRTAAAEQHLAMSVLRAVESDRYLVRCASTGVSAIVDPRGHIEATAPLFVRSVVSGLIYQRDDLTIFVRYGDWWIALCTVIFLAGALFGRRHK